MQLKVSGLELGYDGKTVVRNISFSVSAGDYVCIAGENGAGKSTLLKAILGLNRPISGDIEFNIIRKEIGYLPQQDDIQKDFPASVEEIVLSGCANRSLWRPFYTKEERETAEKSLEKVRISDLTKNVTANCPAGSSSACCWPVH